jgi:hypothetical protein
MGSIYGSLHDYAIGLVALAVVAVLVLVLTSTVVRRSSAPSCVVPQTS